RAAAILPARLHADGYGATLAHLARLGRLELSSDGATPAGDAAARDAAPAGAAAVAAAIVIPGGVIEILPSGDIDLEAATRKLAAKRGELEAEIARAAGRLANPGFVAKAPPSVVAAERAKLEALRAELEAL
ncbi:MAG: hypothetical protein KGL16_14350, partial [Acidobacteriota bacterium]|nr:hypothetical protein [Acidobacteriota bacterium]